jgi:hypothetical protein
MFMPRSRFAFTREAMKYFKSVFWAEGVRALPWLCAILATLGGYWVVMDIWPVWESVFLMPSSPGAWFPDMYAVLAASDLHAAGFDPYGDNPLGAKHLYPRSWFALASIGLDRSDTHVAGLALGGAFLAVSLFWLRPRRYREAVFAVFCLLSPPLTLGFQRANVDNVLYLMLVATACVSVSKREVVRIGVGGVLVMAATLLKFYPIFAAAGAWWNESGRRRWLVIGLYAVLIGVFGVSLWEDYRRISVVVNLGKMADGYLYVFGANFAPLVRPVAFVGLALCGCGAWAGWKWPGLRLPVVAGDVAPAGFVLGGCVLLGCFAIGNSFSYRLVFVLLMIPWWWRLCGSADRSVRFLAGVSLFFTILLLWRDGVAALGLRMMRENGWVDTHNAIVAWHRQVLVAIQWVWCGLVVCLMTAMTRQIPVAKEPVQDRT